METKSAMNELDISVLTDYVTQIYKLNELVIESREIRVLSTFLFGFLEELEEYYEADEREDRISEMGDILAYLTLVLLRFNSISETIHYLANYTKPEPKSTAYLLGNLKRVFRGDESLDIDTLAWRFYSQLMYLEDFSIEEVIEYNLSKLNRRKVNGTIKGRGNR